LSWLLLPPEPGTLKLIAWWEKRRLIYNLALAAFGVAVVLVFCLYFHFKRETGCERSFIWLFIFVVCSNFWYTGSWIVHLLLKLITRRPLKFFGPVMLLAGFVFSLGFITFCLWLLTHM